MELVALFARDVAYDEPDNITVGPHGFALACTDGEDDQWLVAITDDGNVYPFAFNRLNQEEFAGATFSPDGQTLFVNIQGPPGLTFAIWGILESRLIRHPTSSSSAPRMKPRRRDRDEPSTGVAESRSPTETGIAPQPEAARYGRRPKSGARPK